jgi:hypothetical protein
MPSARRGHAPPTVAELRTEGSVNPDEDEEQPLLAESVAGRSEPDERNESAKLERFVIIVDPIRQTMMCMRGQLSRGCLWDVRHCTFAFNHAISPLTLHVFLSAGHVPVCCSGTVLSWTFVYSCIEPRRGSACSAPPAPLPVSSTSATRYSLLID